MEFRVEAINKEFNEKSESIYFYEIPDFVKKKIDIIGWLKPDNRSDNGIISLVEKWLSRHFVFRECPLGGIIPESSFSIWE